MKRQEILSSMIQELKLRGIIKTQKELAELIGGSDVTISGALKGREDYLTQNLLRRINVATGNIFNPAWIITGQGEMLASKTADVENITFGSNSPIGNGNTYTTGADAAELASLRTENGELKTENATLRKEAAEKDKTIARLEGKIEIYEKMITK